MDPLASVVPVESINADPLFVFNQTGITARKSVQIEQANPINPMKTNSSSVLLGIHLQMKTQGTQGI